MPSFCTVRIRKKNPVISTTVFLDDFPSEGQVPDSFTTPQNIPLPPAATRNVLANDAPSLATAREGRAAAHGTLTWQNDGTFHYTPAPNFIGTDRFAYLAASTDAYLLPGTIPWKWLHPNGLDPGTALSGFHSSWMLPAFDDSPWQSGSGMMGYGALGSGCSLLLISMTCRLRRYFQNQRSARWSGPTREGDS